MKTAVASRPPEAEPLVTKLVVKALLSLVGVLQAHGDRAGLFAGHRESLDDADDHQQDRREDAHLTVGRQAADQEGAAADAEQRDHHHELPAVPVGERPQDERTEGTDHVADGEGRHAQQHADPCGQFRWEEENVQDQRRRRAVHGEVVVLQRRADPGGDRRSRGVFWWVAGYVIFASVRGFSGLAAVIMRHGVVRSLCWVSGDHCVSPERKLMSRAGGWQAVVPFSCQKVAAVRPETKDAAPSTAEQWHDSCHVAAFRDSDPPGLDPRPHVNGARAL